MNYWAKNDPLFADGHYVEDWELQRFASLSTALQAFVRAEASRGNKLTSVSKGFASLERPPSGGVFGLPDGLVFVCPIHFERNAFYFESDVGGVIVAADTYDRLYPSGYEPEEEPWEKDLREEQEEWMRKQGWQ